MLSQLISKYKQILVDLQNTHSGKKKFHLIIFFFDYSSDVLSGFPPFTIAGDFISVLVDIVLKNDINFIAPDKLAAAKSVLKESKNNYIRLAGNQIALSQIDKAIDILNMQMLKSNFYVGNLDEGLNVLKSILEESKQRFDSGDTYSYENLPEKQEQINLNRKHGDKYAVVHPDTFREIKSFEILNEIKSEFERLNSYSDTNVNVLLVEQDNMTDSVIKDYSPGTILNLNCQLTKTKSKGNAEVKFENITDTEENVLEEVLKNIRLAGTEGIRTLRQGNPGIRNRRQSDLISDISLKFENVKGIYKGKSFGLAAAVLLACNYFSYANKIYRYKIGNSAAFSGVVEANGKVSGVSSETIAGKITAAFFPWVKYCIVPKENYEDAVKTCDELKLHYPSKQMEIIPVNNVTDVFAIPEVIKKEKISYKNYASGIFNRHKAASISFFVVLTALISFLLANKFLPKDIKDIPVTTNENNFLIFTPDRDTNWIFRNRDVFNSDTIDFGDVAIGDFWNPRLIFINNSRENEEFEINLGGKDKEEFQITWFTDNNQPDAPLLFKPDFPVTAGVKFLPFTSEGKKEAYVEFKSLSSGSIKRIDLKGNAGRLNDGYSVGLLDIDDDIVFESGTNLLNDNFTLSF